MKIEYLSRSQWGSLATTETFIENRYSAAAAEKKTIQVHHTASVDKADTTPNRWTQPRATAYMKSLQWVRPELGPLPYSINLAASEDVETVWVFEGRGVLKVGAHTAGHNRDGLGLAVFGNFDIKDDPAAAALIAAMETISRDLRNGTSAVPWLNYHLPNLGNTTSPQGWEAWGHRDSSTKSCPGNTLYPLLANFTLEDEMTPAQEKALNTLVVLLASRAEDPPPWGVGNWTKYLEEVWTGPVTSDPGPINPVTHIQLAKVYTVLKAAIEKTAPSGTDIDAVIAEIVDRLED